MIKIPHATFNPKATLILSAILAIGGAAKGIATANLLESNLNTVIDGLNEFIENYSKLLNMKN